MVTDTYLSHIRRERIIPTCCHIVLQLIVLLICSAHITAGSTQRLRGKGGWTGRRDVLERTVKNAQNGLISKEKIRLLAGGGKKNGAKKTKMRKFCWVRHNNQNPTVMGTDPVPPLQP